MTKIATSTLVLGALVLLPGFAFAADYPSANINPPYTWAPGAADAPLHGGTHDKGRIVRELNANGIFGETQQESSPFAR